MIYFEGTLLIVAVIGVYLAVLSFWNWRCKRRDLRDRQASRLRKRINHELYKIYNERRG